ncbi:MAG TPA: hypothetical protein PK046_00720 [Candidatus Syntrophosphaera sp.]|nr:hypothetical protein [Candidatus Syntrophosphaera sp.]HPW37825.1 hypothetical protein [Candidatus Syntrophosphaera sp.]HQC47100.1 hypothetical protein [Candidatus Syntrophosphaera sp.]
MTKLRYYRNITKIFAIYWVTVIVSHDSCVWPDTNWSNSSFSRIDYYKTIYSAIVVIVILTEIYGGIKKINRIQFHLKICVVVLTVIGIGLGSSLPAVNIKSDVKRAIGLLREIFAYAYSLAVEIVGAVKSGADIRHGQGWLLVGEFYE